MSFFLQRGVGACVSRVRVYRISRSPDAPLARIVPDTIANDAYIGTYTNDFFGGIAVIEHEGALALVEGPNNMRFALKL